MTGKRNVLTADERLRGAAEPRAGRADEADPRGDADGAQPGGERRRGSSSLFLEELSFRRYLRWSQMALLLVYGVFENFGYRQLTLSWRLRGTLAYIVGSRDWERRDPVVHGRETAERSAA
jgi:hypothetical protein